MQTSRVIVFVARAYGLSTYIMLLHQIICFMSAALQFSPAVVCMRFWHLYASVISRSTCLRSASLPAFWRWARAVAAVETMIS